MSMNTLLVLLIGLIFGCLPCSAYDNSELGEDDKPGVNCIAFSPDGKKLASGGPDNTLKLWDVASGKELAKLSGHGQVNSVVFSPDGKTIASGADWGSFSLWTLPDGKPLYTKTVNPHHSIYSIAFSPDGTAVACSISTVSEITNPLQAIHILDAASGEDLLSFPRGSYGVASVAFGPGGKTLASACDDQTVRVWSLVSRKFIHSLKLDSPCLFAVAISPDGKTLACGTFENTINLWDYESGKELPALLGKSTRITALDFSPDGKLLASGSGDNNCIDIWKMSSHERLYRLDGHSDWVSAVKFSQDGKLLASASRDNTIKIWDVPSFRILRTIEHHPKRAENQTDYAHSILSELRFGYREATWAFLGFILACGFSLTFGVSAGMLTRGTGARTKAVLIAGLLPFGFLLWSASTYEFYAVVDKLCFNRSKGELCQCPLPNGYGLWMCDVTDWGFLYDMKKHSHLCVGRIEVPDSETGEVRVETDGVENVRSLQLAGQFVFGGTDSNAPVATTESVDRYFVLDTKTDKQTEYETLTECRDAARRLGFELDLQPIFDVYKRYAYTWFDPFMLCLWILPPTLLFMFIVRWIFKLRASRH